MSQPRALFIDLRRKPLESWPAGSFTLAYIVSGSLEQSQDFFQKYHKALADIPHITCEMTERDVLHLATRIPSLTRLSLPWDWIIPGLSDHFALDAIVNWDNRRKVDFYKQALTDTLAHGVNHISLYGLQDFAIWQDVQFFLKEHGLFFYDRFHAARPGHESPYQIHTAALKTVIAHDGWSRTLEDGVLRIKGPQAIDWTTHPADVQREETLLMGLFHRQGLPLAYFSAEQVAAAVASGLAIVVGTQLCPTDRGLWDTPKLAAILV